MSAMNSMQRKFGRLMNKNPGDNAKISVLLNDYEDVDRVLGKLVEAANSWREAWINLLSSQLEIVTVYVNLYDPIVGASDGYGRDSAPTPELQLHRTYKLQEAFKELKSELVEEISSIEVRVIKPATEAREFIAPIRKTIKKRENKRQDVEKCQDKVHKLHRKTSKTPKEEASLSKAEVELSNLAEEFEIADAHLLETLPPLIQATFSIIPPLLASHVLVQNRLLGLYYTILSGYCADNDFPNPPPPMDEVIAQWGNDFRHVQKEAESITMLVRGKAAHQPIRFPDENESQQTRHQLSAPPEGFRRTSSGLIPGTATNGTPARPKRTPSAPATAHVPSPQPSPKIGPRPDFSGPNYGGLLKPTDFTTASDLGRSGGNVSPGAVRKASADGYFAGRVPPSPTSTIASTYSQSSNGVVGKKKPPPPPPKRIASSKIEEYVVALYDFNGQGEGDLSFREGDRIKIVKKTHTDQDWWQGEARGVKGSFPANYCKPA